MHLSYKKNNHKIIFTFRFLHPPPAKRKTTNPRSFPSKSWDFINENLKKIFDGKNNGFFVEAGAVDGQFLSNSLYLENDLNWTGLLVEPDKENFEILRSRLRNVWSCGCCLSTKSYPYQVRSHK